MGCRARAALVVEQGAGLVLYHTAHGLRPRWREAAELAAAAASAGANVWSTQPPPLAFYTDDVPERAGKDYRLPAGVRLLARWTVDDLDRALARGEPTCVVIHVQDLQTWDAAQRDRLAHALDGRGLRSVRLPNRFGPKELTLALYASVDLRR
ncbi:MAG TPA: hypothetical protein VK081_08340 [Planctomycetota bacterium]|nr:hypothetical protein [Planctomycetota bacterium]